MHVRVCRECGEEYRPEIAVCADCGGELADSHDDAPPPAPRAALPDTGAIDAEDGEPATVLYYSKTAARDLRPLADELMRVGLPFRIQPQAEPQLNTYCLVVPEHAADEARRVLAPVAERHPELDLRQVAAPMSDDEMEAERERGSCPACEAHLPPDAIECPGCELSLQIVEDEERE